MKKKKIIILVFVVFIIVSSTMMAFSYSQWYNKERVKSLITVELGTEMISIEDFLLEEDSDAVFLGDLSGIDLFQEASYPIQIKSGPRIYDSIIYVKDTVAPTLVLKEISLGIKSELNAEDFVVEAFDLQPLTFRFEKEPDRNKVGDQTVVIIATDLSGNETRAETTLHLANIIHSLKYELGEIEELVIEDFLIGGEDENIRFITDVLTLDLSVVGTHEVYIDFYGKRTMVPVEIVDTVAPTAVAVSRSGYIGGSFRASDFVKDIFDFAEVKVYFETIPDLYRIGEQPVFIKLIDASGNTNVIVSSLSLEKDEYGPVISGVRNFYVEDSTPVNWLSGVTAYDRADGYVRVAVDASAVNLNKEGTYTLVYTAQDSDGHTTRVTAQVVVDFVTPYEPRGSTGSSEVDALADGILSRLINGDMSNSTIMYKVYSWVVNNVQYAYTASMNFHTGAIEGLRYRRGNCYTSAFSVQALLNRAGIGATTKKEYQGRHAWASSGGMIIDPVFTRYGTMEADAQDIIFGGVYIYRTTYSEPPPSELVLTVEYRNERDVPFETVYQINPNPSIYPERITAIDGIDGKIAEHWNVYYENNVFVREYMVTDECVLEEKIDEVIYIGRNIVTTENIPYTTLDECVVTNNSSLDGQIVPGTGIAGIKTITVTVTELDENGVAISFSDPVEEITREMVPAKLYTYVEPDPPINPDPETPSEPDPPTDPDPETPSEPDPPINPDPETPSEPDPPTAPDPEIPSEFDSPAGLSNETPSEP
ncbi:MAG: DUF5011 domain-containing protein [Bacillota bacterium]|nr:DUF5011 domain-containing protein [Bacillota bacterium]